MDLIEDYIINNAYIREEVKLGLIEADEMISYAFVGAFFHFSSPSDNEDGTEEDCVDEDIQIDEVLELYHRLTNSDLNLISNCREVMKKFRDRLAEIEKSSKISDEDKTTLKGIITYILSTRPF